MSNETPPDWIDEADTNATAAELRAKLARTRSGAREATARAKQLERLLLEAETARDLALGTADHVPGAPLAPHSGDRPQVVPALLCSDWHVNEVVTLEDTNGINEFNPEVCRRRVESLWQGFAWYIDGMARFQELAGIFVCLNGDIIDNELHVGNVRSNSMSPMEAIPFAIDMIVPGLEMLLSTFPDQQLRVHMGRGNHERTDRKTPKSQDHQNSIAWVLNSWIARYFRNNPRVSTELATAATSYETILGHDFRIHHGDCFGYQGGVGGITVPGRRWHMRANQTHRVVASLLGHWHQYRDETDIVINGSIKGYDPYANFAELGAEPPRQAAFIVDKHRGKRFGVPIYCGRHGRPWETKQP